MFNDLKHTYMKILFNMNANCIRMFKIYILGKDVAMHYYLLIPKFIISFIRYRQYMYLNLNAIKRDLLLFESTSAVQTELY